MTGLSGVTILIREHAVRTAAAGWETHVFGERVDADALAAAGVTPHQLRPKFLQRRTAGWFASAADKATATGFTLVHGHGDSLNQDVMSLHNCIHAVHEAVRGVALDPVSSDEARLHARQLSERRFRLLLANSNLMRDDVTTRFGVPVERVRVVYPGIDPARYRPRRRTTQSIVIRRRLGVADEDVLAGLVTSGDWVKRGVGDFIEALGIVARGSPLRVHGVVTGKERSMGRYVARAKQHGVGDRLHFLPLTDVLEHVYGALDVFVYPAQFEEFGMCVQEAMACALPVVCGRRIGATELLDPAASKVLLESVNAATVADLLGRFAADEALRKHVGALNAACVAKNSWDRSAAGVLAAYDELSPPGARR
jgi:UDP-glucose:(heptosyl)LPS alpha-1,3-glucosyltransferase